MIVSVAVEKTAFCFDRLFDYEVERCFESRIKVGCIVAVPFGKSNGLRQAVVLKVFEGSSVGCKFIFDVLSERPVCSVELLKVANFLHSSCFCTWFEALRTVLPSGLFFRKQTVWVFNFVEDLELSESELELVSQLKKLVGSTKIDGQIKKLLACGDSDALMLKKKGIIHKSEVFKKRAGSQRFDTIVATKNDSGNLNLTEKQKDLLNFVKKFGPIYAKKACYECGVSRFVLKKLEQLGLIKFVEGEHVKLEHIEHSFCEADFFSCEMPKIDLNKQQQEAADGLINLINMDRPSIALLKGVTGSGKTRVFLKLIEHVLKKGKQVILLVPEIALTPQMVRFFRLFFGNLVAVINSSLTISQQLLEHENIKQGKARLVIGTRSAVFAPCENLGLVIMDEEGEQTYKSSDLSPRYHARDVAKFRCFEFKTLLVLASATPSIETQYFAKIGRYFEFVLPNRYKNAVLPKVLIVDSNVAKTSPIEDISEVLFNELALNLKNKEQSIVLLNRRGYNSSVVCLNCGFKANCPNCSAILTYHVVNDCLICHYCGHVQQSFKVCKNCLSSNVVHFGQGTQKIEQQLAEVFSNVRILRLDSDSVYGRVDLEKKIEDFELGKYDILVGTQIVAKGLNFVNVTLVGVLSIDNMLYGSDFRNSQQVFSLLTQVVGRSGRGEKLGRAIIQTYNPSNAVILRAAAQDYDGFFDEEIVERKEFFCPPFCDLCIVNFSSFNRERTKICAKNFVLECKKMADVRVPVQIMGIATPFVEKLNNRYRKRVIIKCKNCADFRNWIRKVAFNAFSSKCFAGVRANIDMNGEIL